MVDYSAGMAPPSMSSLRRAHESHVTGHTGCQWYEVLLALYPVFPSTVLLNCLVNFAGLPYATLSTSTAVLLEVLILVGPSVAVFTLFHEHLLEVAGIITLAAAWAMAASRCRWTVTKPPVSPAGPRPSFTLVRSVVGLSTAIAILAVDFHVFPRRFAKTEEFGFSLMDVGASSFLLINAVVDARPSHVVSARGLMQSGAVLVCLGVVRLISLAATDYQQHASEYGAHCNFFFVLAGVKILVAPWCRLLSAPLLCVVATLLTLVQHYNTAILQDWVLSELPRDSFLLANRESLVAAPGHAALYCWGALLGKFLFAVKKDSRSQYAASSVRVLIVSSVSAAGVAVVLSLLCNRLQGEPSRRLVNAEFVMWMVLVLLIFTSLGSLVEICLSLSSGDPLPIILQAINGNQMLFFLAANVATGVINMSINTLEVSNPMDTFIITVYAIALCIAVVALLQYRRGGQSAKDRNR